MTERLHPYELFADHDVDLDLRTGRLIPPDVIENRLSGTEAGGMTMSAAKRQRTCAACGGAFERGERTELEPLIDGSVRYLAVHPWHSTHPPHRTVAGGHLTEAA